MLSRAHNFVQALPLQQGIVICADCGFRKEMAQKSHKPCLRKWESLNSGFGGVIFQGGKVIGRTRRSKAERNGETISVATTKPVSK